MSAAEKLREAFVAGAEWRKLGVDPRDAEAEALRRYPDTQEETPVLLRPIWDALYDFCDEGTQADFEEEQGYDYECGYRDAFLKMRAALAAAQEDDRIMIREAGGHVIGMAPSPFDPSIDRETISGSEIRETAPAAPREAKRRWRCEFCGIVGVSELSICNDKKYHEAGWHSDGIPMLCGPVVAEGGTEGGQG